MLRKPRLSAIPHHLHSEVDDSSDRTCYKKEFAWVTDRATTLISHGCWSRSRISWLCLGDADLVEAVLLLFIHLLDKIAVHLVHLVAVFLTLHLTVEVFGVQACIFRSF